MSLFRSKTFRYGLPFIILVVGGSFGLKEFTQIRYTYRQRRAYYHEAKRIGIEVKKPGEVTLESEFEKIKELDINNWKNVRISRPWEE
ncbi:cytochrome c oxidase assembly protein COX16 homolog, mitochondrial [Vespa velutina]|uniref:cytochrome c oxidase assembly protein COX16 homolog, mitochondrial n=1 Tax=Vespa velutina TaxID=202808 RepID=UPI001FB3ACC3|nr:cytochrome c oxidase assembly protein COX16 homolog, mitochondrial [Vespa velutina]XP_047356689.1 cytochrome c oxidase assembly protein COX16 homolog, mitochondrial [Vespa velutina]XP_047356690.1 cytochrome c oxidase assembly protein COX16 homolog, mitochondrial [Vespa velutina]